MLKCTILQRNNADYFDAVSWKQTSLKCASVDLLAAFLGKKSKRTKVWPQKVHLGTKYMKREILDSCNKASGKIFSHKVVQSHFKKMLLFSDSGQVATSNTNSFKRSVAAKVC